MRRRSLSLFAVVAVVAALLVGGCGEKIAIPEPQGLFGVAAYYEDSTIVEADPRQVLAVQGNLFVLSGTALAKRDRLYNPIATAEISCSTRLDTRPISALMTKKKGRVRSAGTTNLVRNFAPTNLPPSGVIMVCR